MQEIMEGGEEMDNTNMEPINMDNVYVRMPFGVAKTILERAGCISREEGHNMLWFERTGYMSETQKELINNMMDELCKD